MRKLWVAAAALIFALAACGGGSDGPKQGTVIDKAYHPERDYDTTMMICSAYSKYGCAVWVPITTHHHDDAWWEVKLDNRGKIGWRDVSEEEFNRCHLHEWCNTRGKS